MDDLKKMEDHPVHTKMDVLPKIVFKSSFLLIGYCGIQARPPNNSDTFAFSSVFILLL